MLFTEKHPSFRHGVHPPECKDATHGRPIERFPFVDQYVLPLSQHIGAPSVAVVQAGQDVRRGELIAKPGGFVSTALHSPVTGRVMALEPRLHPNGKMMPAIVIRADPYSSQRPSPAPPVQPHTLSSEELVRHVQLGGLVGLGGAAFPTHVKLSLPEGKRIRHVIINGCECEPYLTCDDRLMAERPSAVLRGTEILIQELGAEQGTIGIEANKPEAVEALRKAVGSWQLAVGSSERGGQESGVGSQEEGERSVGSWQLAAGSSEKESSDSGPKPGTRKLEPERVRGSLSATRRESSASGPLNCQLPTANCQLSIAVLTVKYPQGAEKMLIDAVLGQEVPSGKFPLDIGVLVNNVATTAALADWFDEGIPLIERVVTVTGPGLARPRNLLVPLGTPTAALIEYCGGLHEATKQVIVGGPMMGMAQKSLEVPVMKGTSGVLAMTEVLPGHDVEYPCIQCGRCLEACPIFLNPTRLARLAQSDRADDLMTYHVLDCFECAACSYICPSNIPLVQWIRMGKAMAREAQKRS